MHYLRKYWLLILILLPQVSESRIHFTVCERELRRSATSRFISTPPILPTFDRRYGPLPESRASRLRAQLASRGTPEEIVALARRQLGQLKNFMFLAFADRHDEAQVALDRLIAEYPFPVDTEDWAISSLYDLRGQLDRKDFEVFHVCHHSGSYFGASRFDDQTSDGGRTGYHVRVRKVSVFKPDRPPLDPFHPVARKVMLSNFMVFAEELAHGLDMLLQSYGFSEGILSGTWAETNWNRFANFTLLHPVMIGEPASSRPVTAAFFEASFAVLVFETYRQVNHPWPGFLQTFIEGRGYEVRHPLAYAMGLPPFAPDSRRLW